MASLTDLQQRREALFKARTDGVRSWRDQNGEEIVYRSDGEMRAALAALDSEIAAMTEGRPPKSIIFRTSKGL